MPAAARAGQLQPAVGNHDLPVALEECFALLLSMTGHGEAHVQRDGLSVAVEVRTLNSRYFKLTVRAGECFLSLEPRIEAVVRQRVRRGTVQVARAHRSRGDSRSVPPERRRPGRLSPAARSSLCDKLHVAESVHLEALLGLPGVVDEQAGGAGVRRSGLAGDRRGARPRRWSNLDQMRRDEGRAMAADLECQLPDDSERTGPDCRAGPAGGRGLPHAADRAV